MSSAADDLDKLEMALTACMRVAKRPGYWEEFQRRAETDIDRPAAAILLLLDKQPCQFQSLVKLLGVEAPSVSRKVHELESAGLILRQPTLDRRVRMLALSPAGQDLSRRLKRAKRAVLADVLADWTPAERGRLVDLLERLSADLSTHFKPKGKVRTS